MSKRDRHKLKLRPRPQAGAAPESEESKVEKSIRELAERLYEEQGGKAIDAAIKRMERLLELHDREAEKLLNAEVTSHRWQVSPSMVIRLQREMEREEARRQALREECWKVARNLVRQWFEERDAAQPAREGVQPAPANDVAGTAEEGGDADAYSRAG